MNTIDKPKKILINADFSGMFFEKNDFYDKDGKLMSVEEIEAAFKENIVEVKT